MTGAMSSTSISQPCTAAIVHPILSDIEPWIHPKQNGGTFHDIQVLGGLLARYNLVFIPWRGDRSITELFLYRFQNRKNETLGSLAVCLVYIVALLDDTGDASMRVAEEFIGTALLIFTVECNVLVA